MSVMILAAWMTASLAAQIEMRAGDAPPPGDVLAVSIEGVTVGFPPSTPGAVGPSVQPTVVGWDRVRAIAPPNDRAAQPFRALADKAWRARTRVERDDLAGAEPLLEELHATYAGLAGPTAAVVGQNLLRCRLARGAQTLAIEPWLTWLGSGAVEVVPTPSKKNKEDPEADLSSLSPAMLDPATGLVPALPPMWMDSPGVQAFARGKAPVHSRAGEGPSSTQKRAAALSMLYWQAARFECGLDPGSIATGDTDAGPSLVEQIVLARAGDPAQREAARGQLRTRLKLPIEPWVEAWCRAAVGRSLLREDSVELRRLGIIELLHVPARLPDQCPYLTGLALAESAVALGALGDRAGADRLRAELHDTFAGHPALDWAPIAAWPAPAPPAPAQYGAGPT